MRRSRRLFAWKVAASDDRDLLFQDFYRLGGLETPEVFTTSGATLFVTE